MKSSAYLCPPGCCDVRIAARTGRIDSDPVYVNGVLTSANELARSLNVTASAMRRRILRRHCLKVAKLTRGPQKTKIELGALFLKFQKLPRFGISADEVMQAHGRFV